jgi:hypothetical protein
VNCQWLILAVYALADFYTKVFRRKFLILASREIFLLGSLLPVTEGVRFSNEGLDSLILLKIKRNDLAYFLYRDADHLIALRKLCPSGA